MEPWRVGRSIVLDTGDLSRMRVNLHHGVPGWGSMMAPLPSGKDLHSNLRVFWVLRLMVPLTGPEGMEGCDTVMRLSAGRAGRAPMLV